MSPKRQTRHFLTLEEFSDRELMDLLKLAAKMKSEPRKYQTRLKGQTIAMIFDKNSTRTRVSFEVAMVQLGGYALFLPRADLQLGRGETIHDTVHVLSRMVQSIVVRTFTHPTIEEFAAHSTVPVINALTDAHHPCQVLADLLTLKEAWKSFKGKRLLYLGDGNNMSHSLMLGAAKVGLNIRVVCPADFSPDPQIVARAKKIALKNHCEIEILHSLKNIEHAVDAIYTDAWTSMGQEDEKERRKQAFAGYCVTDSMMSRNPRAIFLHCLPAYRGEEVMGSVLDGAQSRVWDQAENRLHAQKALLLTLLK